MSHLFRSTSLSIFNNTTTESLSFEHAIIYTEIFNKINKKKKTVLVLPTPRGRFYGEIIKVLNFYTVVNEFKPQFCNWIHFPINALGKDIDPFIVTSLD